jgi:hypothetical protein
MPKERIGSCQLKSSFAQRSFTFSTDLCVPWCGNLEIQIVTASGSQRVFDMS